MELKELVYLKKLSFGILSLTGSLVVLLGLVLWANVSSSNPYTTVAAAPQVVSNRAPASLPDVTNSVTKVEPQPVLSTVKKELRTFDLNCQGQLPKAGKATFVSVEQIRFRSGNCNGDIATIEIVNASNGYVATVFQTGADQLSSDYIHLSEGDNIIKVRLQDRQGSFRSSELLFSRSLAN